MSKWPKQLPHLTEKQKWVKKDFMKHVLDIFPNKFGGIRERFSYSYPVKNCCPGGRVLDIGAGYGDAIYYEDLTKTEYFALELLPEIAKVIKERFPNVHVIIGDCQEHLVFPDNFFDRVNALDVLEHLPNLPAALREVRRVLKPDGEFCVVIPCEGLPGYIGHTIVTKRAFKKLYNMDYKWWMKSEHINMPQEVLKELDVYFTIQKKTFFPLRIPSLQLNLALALILKPHHQPKPYSE